MRPTWAEIDLSAIAHNVREIRRVTHPRAEIMAVVKANAYGHGVLPVAATALANGANSLAVAIPEEGALLREHGISAPILILGLTLPEQAEEVVRFNLMPAVATWESALALSRAACLAGRPVNIFVKLDTGMHRIGLQHHEAVSFIKRLLTLKGVVLQGLFTHYSMSDMRDKDYTFQQFSCFQQIVEDLYSQGIHVPLKSTANSAAVIDLPDTHRDIVRPGIILYGLAPSDEVGAGLSLIPAMQFKTRVIYVKKVPSGSKISYGGTHTTVQETVIATLPVGYADGYNRLLSNQGEVLIQGTRCPVVGRVCMDQITVDVTHLPSVSLGEEAVLFGKQGQAEITIDEIADKLHTINYEIVCAVSGRVPRIYVHGNEDNK